MAKDDINKLIKQSTTDNKLDDKKTSIIASELNRKSLKQYIRELRKFEKSKKVTIEIPQNQNNLLKDDLQSLFPGKEIEIIENPELILGLKIISGDDVMELNLAHKLGELVSFIKDDEINEQQSKIAESKIISRLEDRLKSFTDEIEQKYENIGYVQKNSDGVIVASGLSKVTMGELVTIESSSVSDINLKYTGVVLNFNEDSVSIIILSSTSDIKEGDLIRRTNNLLSIPVSDETLGRVIDPLGNPLDGRKIIKSLTQMPLERIAAGVVEREPVNTPLKTGIKAVDTMLPIGRGQRELIIGDRGLGKTAIAIDTIINQKSFNKKRQNTNAKSDPHNTGIDQRPVTCIYVAIGQKQSSIAQTIEILREKEALDYTVIVAAPSSSPAAQQYLAPYAGCAIAEYFMEKGEDVLIVYDDLTKHAWAYRQLSLVLQRPAGREAYPGDIFYLHSRLLERSVKLNKKNGGGSITALPIIETQASDISAYIPTNVISITDGQIYLEPSLFNIGIRPAINPGSSVSRVGGAAQTKAIKSVSGKLRLELAQYNSLAAFAQFGSDLDATTLKQLERGKRIVEILKQPQLSPLSEPLQIISVWSVTNGYLDDVPVENISEFEMQLHDYFLMHETDLLTELGSGDKLTDKLTQKLIKAIEDFKKGNKFAQTEKTSDVNESVNQNN